MKEKPILFSAEMVKAILEDKKTQTRRVIKPQPIQDPDGSWRSEIHPRSGYGNEQTLRHYLDIYCPYGKKGDRLWVRETWAHDDENCKDPTCGNRDHIWWKASENKIVADSFAGDAHWRPSIFMPRWASRIDLKIVKVRVERVQEITHQDALAEGMIYEYPVTPITKYVALWDELNAQRGYGWAANPWVWVIEFKRDESGICILDYDMTDGANL